MRPRANTPAPVHGGDVGAAAARWGLAPDDIVDFSANISPFGPPPGALAAARAALAAADRYPEPYAVTLRACLGARHGVPQGAVLVSNGATEAIHLLLRPAAGRRVALPVPGFAEYGRAARAVGAAVVAIDGLAPAGLSAAGLVSLGEGLAPGDAMFICNPHNPTGRLLSPGEVLAVVRATRAMVIVDEAFIDLTGPGEAGSVVGRVLDYDNLVVVRSLTKFYAMPGLRSGYAVARPELVAALDAVRDPWSVSAPAQAAAAAALDDGPYAERVRRWVAVERDFLSAELARLPDYTVEPPAANFILVRAPEPAWALQDRLGPRGILIRDCRSFAGLSERHLRVAVRTRAENLRLLAALRSG